MTTRFSRDIVQCVHHRSGCIGVYVRGVYAACGSNQGGLGIIIIMQQRRVGGIAGTTFSMQIRELFSW